MANLGEGERDSWVIMERQKGGVARLTLNDPDCLNAMSEKMAACFAGVVQSLRDDDDLRMVVITGAGRRPNFTGKP